MTEDKHKICPWKNEAFDGGCNIDCQFYEPLKYGCLWKTLLYFLIKRFGDV